MSKANQKFVQADEAVSPVIGVILMVAITVVLAAVVFVLVSNLSKGGSESPPDANLVVAADNSNDDLVVQHRTGETIKSGDYKISVRAAGTSAPVYVTCTGDDFAAGGELRISSMSNGTGALCVFGSTAPHLNNTAIPNDQITIGTYRVVIFHIPSNSIILDDEYTVN